MRYLWLRIKWHINIGDTVVDVDYRLSNKEEEVNETFYRQLEAASILHALVLMGDFEQPSICWEGDTVRHTVQKDPAMN